MRILRWRTFWGGHLDGSSVAPAMVLAVVIASIGPPVLGLAGVDLDPHHLRWTEETARILDIAPELLIRILHALLEWISALFALLVGAFALVRCRADPTPEAPILTILPLVAVLDIAHGLTGLTDETTALWLWTWSRCLFATVLVLVGGLTLWRPGIRLRVLALVQLALGGVTLVVAFGIAEPPRLIAESSLLPRPWELPPLLLFAAAALTLLPQLHRLRPSALNHALILSMVPQVVVHLETGFGSIYPFDGSDLAAHLAKVVGFATLLVGIVFDYIYTQASREHAVHGFETAQIEIRKRTRELEQVARERVDTDLKRQRAERSLRILEKAVETMSMGVTVTDLRGKILYTNPADAKMHGYTVDELLGNPSSSFAPSHDHDSLEVARLAASGSGQPWNRERINLTRTGRELPVRLVSDVVRDEADEPIALVTICEDISDRRHIEAAVERRDRILESVGLAAERFLSDPRWETSVSEVLDSLKEATGVKSIALRRVPSDRDVGAEGTASDSLDDTWGPMSSHRELAPREALDEVLLCRREELEGGLSVHGSTADLAGVVRTTLESCGVRSFAFVPIIVASEWTGCLVLEDQEEREWTRAELKALRAAARTFAAALQRKQAEEILATAQAQYQDLLESANDLVQSVSPEGTFQIVNRAWRETLGYSPEEVSHLTVWDVVRSEDHETYRRALEKIRAGLEQPPVEVVFVTKDGTEIYVEGNLNYRFVEGRPVAARGIFRDITERKMVDRMKQEFISTVSHELRTPLTSIIASLGLLNSGRLAAYPERIEELVAVAHRNSNRLLQLINDLLDLQKLAAGKITYHLAPTSVRTVLEDAMRGIRAYADSLKIRLVLEPADPTAGPDAEGPDTEGPDTARPGTECLVMADPDRLIQVLNNLLSNAIKFSSKGEEVHLGATTEGERVVIFVRDRGPGIPKEFERRLFEQFTQVDSSPTRTSGGSGLGLSIAKGLVDGMHGEIRLVSKLGTGTTFYVDLPAAPHPALAGRLAPG